MNPKPAPASTVEITREDPTASLKAYQAEQSPIARGRIYLKELDPILAQGDLIPFDRAVFTADNTLGTLVSDIVSQRTLAQVQRSNPLLNSVTTDFSVEQGSLGAVVYTRVVGEPTVDNFAANPSPANETDFPVTLSNHKQVSFAFPVTETLGTNRNLVAEYSDSLSYALGNHLVGALAALITTDFTDATIKTAANTDWPVVAAINKALTTQGAPGFGRFAWINSDVAETLITDEIPVSSLVGPNDFAYAHWRNRFGFSDIWELPSLPANTINLTGFFGQKSSLLISTRVPVHAEGLLARGYKGTMKVVTDPVTGLSVVSNQWVDQRSLTLSTRLVIIYGVARGILDNGHRLVSA